MKRLALALLVSHLAFAQARSMSQAACPLTGCGNGVALQSASPTGASGQAGAIVLTPTDPGSNGAMYVNVVPTGAQGWNDGIFVKFTSGVNTQNAKAIETDVTTTSGNGDGFGADTYANSNGFGNAYGIRAGAQALGTGYAYGVYGSVDGGAKKYGGYFYSSAGSSSTGYALWADGTAYVTSRLGIGEGDPDRALNVVGNGKLTGQLEVDGLKTTGAATGKAVVCVDVSTGQLYASSSGVACAN